MSSAARLRLADARPSAATGIDCTPIGARRRRARIRTVAIRRVALNLADCQDIEPHVLLSAMDWSATSRDLSATRVLLGVRLTPANARAMASSLAAAADAAEADDDV